jgi:hypothetical protein
MVQTPVGMKCPDCGNSRGLALFRIRPERLVLAGVTALVAGVGAALVSLVLSIFIIFFAAPYGYFAGSMILRASGMKRGATLEMVAGAGMVAGGLAFRYCLWGVHGILNLWFLIALGISTACAVSKVRYL